MSSWSRPRRRAALGAAALALVALLGACSGSDAVTQVSSTEVADIVADPDVVVLDVRTPAEFAAGHLPDAINIDVESPSFTDDVGELPQDDTYLVYCRSGNRSGTATDQMADLGFTSLYDLQGGIVDYQSAGGTIVTG